MVLPLRNCSLGEGVTSWGILVELGTPPQRLCLSASTVVNNTLVSLRGLCAISDPGMTSLACMSLRGGLFEANRSSTWNEILIDEFSRGRPEPAWTLFNPSGITKGGSDKLYIRGSPDLTVDRMEIALNERGNESNAGMLGLGLKSSFLETSLNAKQIPCTAWSLEAGSQSSTPREGELVLGGYNNKRLDGSFYWSKTLDMTGDRPCPLRVDIARMRITMRNGTVDELMASTDSTKACAEAYDNRLRLSKLMLDNFKDITRYNPNLTEAVMRANDDRLFFTELGLLYEASNIPDWTLSMTLNGGLDVTIPREELMTPLVGTNEVGEKEVVPGIMNLAIFNEPTDEGEVPVLGKAVLSQVSAPMFPEEALVLS